jgi:hypothetical protein
LVSRPCLCLEQWKNQEPEPAQVDKKHSAKAEIIQNWLVTFPRFQYNLNFESKRFSNSKTNFSHIRKLLNRPQDKKEQEVIFLNTTNVAKKRRRLELVIVLVLANHAIREDPGRYNGKNKKSYNNKKRPPRS